MVGGKIIGLKKRIVERKTLLGENDLLAMDCGALRYKWRGGAVAVSVCQEPFGVMHNICVPSSSGLSLN